MSRLEEKHTFTLIGEEREGGYTYVHSPDLPGFTFMLEPGEEKDVETVIEVIEPSLKAYVIAFLGKDRQKPQPVRAAYSYADVRKGHSLNLAGELLFA
jgi:hypothetical protein